MYLRKPLHVTSHSKQAILVDSYDTTGYVLAIRPATNRGVYTTQEPPQNTGLLDITFSL